MPGKYLPLLWANLRRKPLRTGLTFGSILIAFLLFGLLRTVNLALTGGAELAGVDRLVTMHKVSLIVPLPIAHVDRIRGIDGVLAATPHNWIGGSYQDDRNQISAITTDVPSFAELYPEYGLTDEQIAAWIADRSGAIVGASLAATHGWRVGDTIPVRSSIYVKEDGDNTWDLNVIAVYSASNGDNASVYFHYDYLNEALPANSRGITNWIGLRIVDPDRAAEIAANIDAVFANSEFETKTSTESAFLQGFANQMGNIAAIVTAVASAVFFTMLLVTANTMAQSVRERTAEIAVLKTLGFGSVGVTGLVLAESLLITALGAAAGLALASLAASAVGELLQQFFPVLGVPTDTYLISAALVLLLGTLTAALPCAEAWRLKITDALARV
jgi:putative ABC transport system permease protein